MPSHGDMRLLRQRLLQFRGPRQSDDRADPGERLPVRERRERNEHGHGVRLRHWQQQRLHVQHPVCQRPARPPHVERHDREVPGRALGVRLRQRDRRDHDGFVRDVLDPGERGPDRAGTGPARLSCRGCGTSPTTREGSRSTTRTSSRRTPGSRSPRGPA